MTTCFLSSVDGLRLAPRRSQQRQPGADGLRSAHARLQVHCLLPLQSHLLEVGPGPRAPIPGQVFTSHKDRQIEPLYELT